MATSSSSSDLKRQGTGGTGESKTSSSRGMDYLLAKRKAEISKLEGLQTKLLKESEELENLSTKIQSATVDACKALLAGGADANQVLCLAAIHERPEVVRLILAHFRSALKQEWLNIALLLVSIHGGDCMNLVQPLVEAKADVHVCFDLPFIYSVIHKRGDIAKFLISRGANINVNAGEAILHATKNGDMEMARMLIASGFLPDTVLPGEILLTGAQYGHLDFMTLAFSWSPFKSETLSLALTAACAAAKYEAVKFLLDRGAKDTKSPTGSDSNFCFACARGDEELVSILLIRGANVTGGDNAALRAAISAGHTKIADLLVKAGADASIFEHEALLQACREGDADIIKGLIESKVDVAAKNNQALCEAAKSGKLSVVQVLLAAGVAMAPGAAASIELAMQFALAKKHYDVAQCLIATLKTSSSSPSPTPST